MKIYLIKEPSKNEGFAEFSHVGTWSDGDICEECENTTERLIEPLLIEWEPGYDMIGDFSWCGYTSVIQPHVKKFMIDSSFECNFKKVEVVSPTTKKKKNQKLIEFPYKGPELSWLFPNKYIKLNQEKSGVTLRTDCSLCKQKDYTFIMDKIVIDKAKWRGEKIFRIEQFIPSAATFITEDALNAISGRGFTNFGIHEAGFIG